MSCVTWGWCCRPSSRARRACAWPSRSLRPSRRPRRGVKVQIQNAPAGLVARVEPATVDVQVQGPVSIINKLRPEDLEVRVDGAALSLGRRSVTPEVHGPPEVTVLTIKPTAVLVVVTRKGS